MSNVIRAALSTSLELPAPAGEGGAAPADLQYMPPGRHRIRANRAGRPVTLDITVDAGTADTLDRFLKDQLARADKGEGDRPFFDFNHEDREAAAWPTAFFWAGDDPLTGGVRARVEWSGAGRDAVLRKTFRRFSPTFIPDDRGRVTGSETNMGGLVNRAAFKSIQPLFAKENQPANPPAASPKKIQNPMPTLIQTLRDLNLVQSADVSEEAAAEETAAAVKALRAEITAAKERVRALETEKAETAKARAAALVDEAVRAGKIASGDTETRDFWVEAALRDEARAVKALEALPLPPVLSPVTGGADPVAGALDRMARQQKAIAEARPFSPELSSWERRSPDRPDRPPLTRQNPISNFPIFGIAPGPIPPHHDLVLFKNRPWKNLPIPFLLPAPLPNTAKRS